MISLSYFIIPIHPNPNRRISLKNIKNEFSTLTQPIINHIRLATQGPQFPSWDKVILSFPTNHWLQNYFNHVFQNIRLFSQLFQKTLYVGKLGPACKLHGADMSMILKTLLHLFINCQNIIPSPHGSMCTAET